MFHVRLSRRTFLEAAAAVAGAAVLPRLSARVTAETEPDRADLTALTLSDASRLVRQRQVSPVELTRACLERIDRLNPVLNAFITVTRETALAQASAAESEIRRGQWRGPLHGVPIALKDLFDTAGIRTTAGSALFKDRTPTVDAEVVRRLKAAGAVILGKTNMVEFAYGTNAAVSAFGATRNPWSLEHNPGGSSSGSAVAVAARLCFGALGSDTAGSIRVPASFCGIVGLKPTYGLVSTRGAIPLSWSCDHVGPLARSVEDLTLLLQAIAGYDAADTNSADVKIPDYRLAVRSKARLRIGVPRDFFFEDLDPEFQRIIDGALTLVQKIAANVRDVDLPVAARDQEPIRVVVRGAEAYAYHETWVKATPELYLPETLLRIRGGAEISTTSYIGARRALGESRRGIARLFHDVDLLVTPTTPEPPTMLAALSVNIEASMRLTSRTPRNTAPFNNYGIPSISVPCGFTAAGLPVGLQISGPHWGESSVLQFAAAFERAAGIANRAPTLV